MFNKLMLVAAALLCVYDCPTCIARIVKVDKYLVKWRNLSYRECTWETKEELADDAVIAKVHHSSFRYPRVQCDNEQ